ncbi:MULTISPECIES: DUF4443 domain-containing protein [Acidianus]|uniref:Uncharacterized protein n=1 Tax=Candidatus Acidianus copahuensis TaxID=1160895 RepID=A0A031LPA6_9CREN|nr:MULTISPECIES: DUF4443 domain-containing protein [Acidianus]EZQ06826.1 hypothetical protein CM19_05490 [Candidatus Acidianus copahuensis]NON61497.1 winged helix-turn-helix domain-containing protein [Acidianus sp. RZ1]
MDILATVTEATKPKKGNSPKYDYAHVLMALDIISKDQPIGRPTLTKKLELGEATVRTMIKRLKELGLIKVDKIGGMEISDKGKTILEEWNKNVNIKQERIESINWDSVRIVLKNKANLLDKYKITELRDIIIREGAKATLIVVKGKKGVEIPPRTDEFALPGLLEEIKEKLLDCSSGDLILYIMPDNIYLAYRIGIFLLSD